MCHLYWCACDKPFLLFTAPHLDLDLNTSFWAIFRQSLCRGRHVQPASTPPPYHRHTSISIPSPHHLHRSCVRIFSGSSRLDCVNERLNGGVYPIEAIPAGTCSRSGGGHHGYSTYTIADCTGGEDPPPAKTLNADVAFTAGTLTYFSDLNCETAAAAGPGGVKVQTIAALTSCRAGATPEAPIVAMGSISGADNRDAALSWCDAAECAFVCRFNSTADCLAGSGTDQKALLQQFDSGACRQIAGNYGPLNQPGACNPVYDTDGDDYNDQPFLYSLVATVDGTPAPAYPAHNAARRLPPMVMVPGLTNSNLNMKLDGAKVPGGRVFGCNTTTHGQYVPLWPVPSDALDDVKSVPCYAYYLSYKFDLATQSFHTPPGVDIQLQDVGGVDGMPGLVGAVQSYQLAGWTVGKDFGGAPYDWRLPVSQQQAGFINQTKGLVEQLYATNAGRKVVLMGVSFGPQNALGFLHAMTQDWKDKYIDWFVALSPVWSGSALMLSAYVSGPPFHGGGGGGSDAISELYLALFHQTPFAGWTFPRATGSSGQDLNYTWSKDDVLISTPRKNYTTSDYEQLFADLGYTPSQKEVINFAIKDKDLFSFDNPGVNTFVAYGYGLPTTATAVYDEGFHKFKTPPQPNATVMCSGDGLVPLRSSKRGYLWKEGLAALNKKLIIKGYAGQHHAGCMTTQPSDPNQCFLDWFEWIVNGTGVASDPADLVAEGPCETDNGHDGGATRATPPLWPF